MKYATVALLCGGMVLLGVILHRTDLTEVWARLSEVGWSGTLTLLAVQLCASLAGAWVLLFTVPSARLNPQWAYHLWKIWMTGEAFNMVTPLASFGGEPVKATLLKKHYGIDYRTATAVLVLSQTITITALAFFLAIGVLLMFRTESVPSSYRLTAGIGLAGFSLCVLLLFLTQRYRTYSRISRWIGGGRETGRVQRLLEIIHDIEGRLVTFYTGHGRSFALAAGCALSHWVLGVVRTYCTLGFLGHPVTFTEAWVIEAAVMLVRVALFVIPANLGTQEATLLVICGAITGSSTLGLAVAVVRRFLEITWVVWGLLLGWTVAFGREESPHRLRETDAVR